MLALDVNLLSSKLQKQTLDDSQSVKLINPESNYKLSESAQAKLGAGATVKNVLQVSLSSNGKLGDVAFTIPENTRNIPVTKGLCFHKHKYSCQLCEDVLCQISSERPIKRHCRSISMPQEVNIDTPQAKSTWQPQGSLLWKPVATRKSNSHAWCDGKWDVRCSPVDFTKFEIANFTQFVHSHVKTAHQKIEPGHITLDHLITPPESPVPRPGSVYSDGAISPFTADSHYVHHFHDFKSHSLSVEEKMCCLTNFTGSATNFQGYNTSVPSSPHHHYRVPRCQSQPSFYDRKSRRKRRRDCRPTINFTKMSQTAYRSSNGPSVDDEGTSGTNLMPIASSPRDSDGSMMNAFALSNPSTSVMHEQEITNRDHMSSSSVMDEAAENSGPVKFLGEDDQNDTDMEVFQITEELDLAQIENS